MVTQDQAIEDVDPAQPGYAFRDTDEILVTLTDANGIETGVSVMATIGALRKKFVPDAGTSTGKPPTVTLELSAASTTAGKSIVLTAKPVAGTAAIKQIEFFDGGTPISPVITAQPYQYTYTVQTAGAHALVAKVTDAAGIAATSEVAYLQVAAVGSVQPNVTLNPVTPTSAPLGTSFTLVASASVQGGSIAKVEFFDGAALIGTDTSTPFAVSYTPGSTGQHVFSAKATDLNGNTAISLTQTVSITAVATGPNQLPTVSLTLSPNTLTMGQSTTLAATAADTDGTITKVEFFDGSTSLQVVTSAPYQYIYTPTGSTGNRQIKAIATDNSGGTAVAGQVLSITAAATAPGAPTIGASTAGDGYATTTATAPASSGTSPITSYKVYQVGVSASIGSVAAGQALTFTKTGLPNGTPVQFQWSAVSNAGEGDRSAASAAVTPTAAVVVPSFELRLPPNQEQGYNTGSMTWYTVPGVVSPFELRYNSSVDSQGVSHPLDVASTPAPPMEVYLGGTSNSNLIGQHNFASEDMNYLCGVNNRDTGKLYYQMQIINSDGTLGAITTLKFTSGSVLLVA